MIDELAKAICESTPPEGTCLCCKTEGAPKCKPMFTRARAVLTRLREPTPEMVEAGRMKNESHSNICEEFCGWAEDSDFRLIFRAMIDAAMEGGK